LTTNLPLEAGKGAGLDTRRSPARPLPPTRPPNRHPPPSRAHRTRGSGAGQEVKTRPVR